MSTSCCISFESLIVTSQHEESNNTPPTTIRDPPIASGKGRPRTARLTGPSEGRPRGGGAKGSRAKGRVSRWNHTQARASTPPSPNVPPTLTSTTNIATRKRKRVEHGDEVELVESRPGKRQVTCAHCRGDHSLAVQFA